MFDFDRPLAVYIPSIIDYFSLLLFFFPICFEHNFNMLSGGRQSSGLSFNLPFREPPSSLLLSWTRLFSEMNSPKASLGNLWLPPILGTFPRLSEPHGQIYPFLQRFRLWKFWSVFWDKQALGTPFRILKDKRPTRCTCAFAPPKVLFVSRGDLLSQRQVQILSSPYLCSWMAFVSL